MPTDSELPVSDKVPAGTGQFGDSVITIRTLHAIYIVAGAVLGLMALLYDDVKDMREDLQEFDRIKTVLQFSSEMRTKERQDAINESK